VAAGRRPQKPAPAPAIPSDAQSRYSVLSRKPTNLVIGGAGLLLILAGVALNLGVLPVVQPYWWIPTAIGILMFSQAFQV
jgi:hypothetical protein